MAPRCYSTFRWRVGSPDNQHAKGIAYIASTFYTWTSGRDGVVLNLPWTTVQISAYTWICGFLLHYFLFGRDVALGGHQPDLGATDHILITWSVDLIAESLS